MEKIVFKTQYFLFSVMSSLIIYQFEPIMLSRGLTQQMGLTILSVAQFIGMFSIFLSRFLISSKKSRDHIIRIGLLIRVVSSMLMLVLPYSETFIVLFLIYQFVATGLDVFFEGTMLDWAVLKQENFGRFRMFGSLGYALSGIFASVIVMISKTTLSLLVFLLLVNVILLFLSYKNPTEIDNRTSKKKYRKKIYFKNYILLIITAFLVTLPNSFGFVLNTHFVNEFSVSAEKAMFYSGIALIIGSCLSEMAGFFSIEWLISKLKLKKVIILGGIFSVFRWCIASQTESLSVFLLTYAFHGVCFSMIYIGTITWIYESEKNVELGEISLLFSSFATVINFLIVTFFSKSLLIIGSKGILTIYSLLSFVILVLIILLVSNRRNNQCT